MERPVYHCETANLAIYGTAQYPSWNTKRKYYLALIIVLFMERTCSYSETQGKDLIFIYIENFNSAFVI